MKEHIYKYGIDYGTTNSSIALSIYDGNDIVTTVFEVEDTAPRHIMPSKVCVYGKKDIRVGRGVEVDDESKMLRAVKMALETKNSSGKIKKNITVGDEVISLVDVIAAVMRQLRIAAEREIVNFGVKVSGVVLGVPVEFGDEQKKILKEALVKAEFYQNMQEAEEQTEFVSEPLAVAVDYGEKTKVDKNVLVFDFGGGTLDIAIMNLKRDVGMSDHLHPHTVISKHRETIGGEKLNEMFFVNSFCSEKKYGTEYLRKAFGIPTPKSPQELWKILSEGRCGANGYDFIEALEKLKCNLSIKPAADFKFLGNAGVMIEPKKFYREDFEHAISAPLPGEKLSAMDLIKKAIDTALDMKNIDADSEIDTVITAGGSSLIPCIQEYLYDRFTNQLHHDAGKTEKLTSIVRGLSIVGCKEKDILDDVVDNSYGFWEVNENAFQPVITAGTKIVDTAFNKEQLSGICIPIRKKDKYYTTLCLDIYQKNRNGELKLGTIQVVGAESNSYRIFMSVDKKQGVLSVYLYDNENRVWLDDQGKVSTADCRYHLKEI